MTLNKNDLYQVIRNNFFRSGSQVNDEALLVTILTQVPGLELRPSKVDIKRHKTSTIKLIMMLSS